MPANLSRIADPSTFIGQIAVAACRTADGTHAGIVYRDGVRLRLLHLAFHLDLRSDDFETRRDKYVCVVPNLLSPEQIALAGYCRRVFLANSNGRRIPYNLRYDEGTGFDPETGDLVLGDHGTGMSCATFVVHFFRSACNPIVHFDGWPKERPGDRERQQSLVRALQNVPTPYGDVYRKQARRIEGEIGCARIRPEEVAGACLEHTLPAHFHECEVNGTIVLSHFDMRERAIPHE